MTSTKRWHAPSVRRGSGDDHSVENANAEGNARDGGEIWNAGCSLVWKYCTPGVKVCAENPDSKIANP